MRWGGLSAIAGVVIVVGVALAQAAFTASASYTSPGEGLRALLGRADSVIPPHADFTVVWAAPAAKPGREARYVLYPRRDVRITSRHRVTPRNARSRLRTSGVHYVIVLGRRNSRRAVRTLYAALDAPWSRLILDGPAGAVYRIDP